MGYSSAIFQNTTICNGTFGGGSKEAKNCGELVNLSILT